MERTHLGHDHDVRSHPTILDVKHPSCPSESTLHLVGDEEYAMPIADATQPLQESRWSRDVTTFAEHRFDNDRCGVRRCRLLSEQQFQLVKRCADKLRLVRSRDGAEMMPIRERRGQRSRLVDHPISDKETRSMSRTRNGP